MSLRNLTNQQLLIRLREIVLNNLENENFCVEDLALAAGVSSTTLRRKFSSVSEKSLSHFIREIRLQKALEILHNEDVTSSEVSYRVGFGSPAYFSTCFKDFFGYSPSEAKGMKFEDSSNVGILAEIPGSEPVQENTVGKRKKKPAVLTVGVILISVLSYLIINNLSFDEFSILPVQNLDAEDKSIAVIPLESIGNLDENEAFTKGVTDNILSNLIQIREIKVINSPVHDVKNNPAELRRIAISLGVRFILTGSVQRTDNRVMIIVRLIDTSNNQEIWSEQYDRQVTDIFDVQSDIARQVASTLHTIIPASERSRIERKPTINPVAHEHYIMGKYLLDKRPNRDENNSRYITPFEKAIEEDENFAEAYVGLANTYIKITEHRCFPSPDGFTKAKEYAQDALELDPDLAAAHAILGTILFRQERQWEEAKKELKTALELNPNDATIHTYYYELMYILRNRDEYAYHVNRALELNPLSPYLILERADLFRNEGNYERALEEMNKVKDLDPTIYSTYYRLYDLYIEMGDGENAVKELQAALSLDSSNETFVKSLDSTWKSGGIEALEKSYYDYNILTDEKGSWHGAARYCLRIGQKQKALEWLEKGFEWDNPKFSGINGDPALDGLRNEPRFLALLEKMNLSNYQ